MASGDGLGPGDGIPIGPAEAELLKIVRAPAPRGDFDIDSGFPPAAADIMNVEVQVHMLTTVASDPGITGLTAQVVAHKADCLRQIAILRSEYYGTVFKYQNQLSDLFGRVRDDYRAQLPRVELPAVKLRALTSEAEGREAFDQIGQMVPFGWMVETIDLTGMGLGRFYGPQARNNAIRVISRQREAIAFPLLAKHTATGITLSHDFQTTLEAFKEAGTKKLDDLGRFDPPPAPPDPGVPGPGEPGFPWGNGIPGPGDDHNGDDRNGDDRDGGDGDGDDKPPFKLPDPPPWPPDWWPPKEKLPDPDPEPDPDPYPKIDPWHKKPGTGYDSTLPTSGTRYSGTGSGYSTGTGIGSPTGAGTSTTGTGTGTGFGLPPTGISTPGRTATNASTNGANAGGRGTSSSSSSRGGMGMMPGQGGAKSGDKDKKKPRNRYFPPRNNQEQKPHPLIPGVITRGPIYDKNHPLAKEMPPEELAQYMTQLLKDIGEYDDDPYEGWRT